MTLGLPLEVCLLVYDDILGLSCTALEKLMKRWLKAYYLILNINILAVVCWVKLACLRTVAKKSDLI